MRKLVIDADPGIDDALTLALALFDPDVEVIAATSVGGTAAPEISARNLQGIVEYLDPPRLPRVGVGTAPDDGLPFEARRLDSPDGPDGLGGVALPIAERCAPRAAEKVICDAVRFYPRETSILALGPLTNVARAFQRDPEIPFLLNRVIVAGGAYATPGNITPSAEFNIFCDPKSAKYVFQSPCAKTLVPLDVSESLPFSLDDFDRIDVASGSEVGTLIRRFLLLSFRARRKQQGAEVVYFKKLIAYFAAVAPIFFSTLDAAGDVEVSGELTRGTTVFDRRSRRVWRRNMEVVYRLDADSVRQKILDGFNRTVRTARPRR